MLMFDQAPRTRANVPSAAESGAERAFSGAGGTASAHGGFAAPSAGIDFQTRRGARPEQMGSVIG
jgi:hypothetical protein